MVKPTDDRHYEEPTVGGIYRHHKGNDYIVVANAKWETNGDPVVVYKDYNDETKVWVRTLKVFAGTLPDGEPRFKFLG